MTLAQQQEFDAAFDELTYVHDELQGTIKDLGSQVHGGDIGWNQAMELGVQVTVLREQAQRIETVIARLYPMRTDE